METDLSMPLSEMAELLDQIIEDFKVTKEDLMHPKAEKIELIYYKLLLEFGFAEKVGILTTNQAGHSFDVDRSNIPFR